ncbi:MAG: 2-C-methyl-D-erythritol 2,4-cyclodiphosphate synthase [Candidatus Thioglobus sp.]|nr:2-C-methyl-D-erythritol 2,4-cyclodiphosphate synthase [Candidatus Thioglobus sp.]MBT3965736.1 2-C-methyl-D-erythritol 2,4-cyclodiphosphate synthase [Candidatus Thioglobus sp.]MBT4315959.1 2-C-methyl-D-erythritol 2,4-cyclodiphosphate synthase [Candidatus Thioglobus sp.]MBT4923495.1 2-C-methyl-D-erythritol 2,4-cyclodiphosphate synthase [Candidatus Thioglobus sp.]MBT5286695.1 2-C-methyl-D-erythritol 2,4-cyclodiphosphate synthase [Candidatus Thioglobus sp.]
MKIKTGIGQDSHAFETQTKKSLILGGVTFDHPQGLKGNSDADVILHSLTNAVSSITTKNILGAKADELCQQGITDSSEYLKLALNDLNDWKIDHIAISIECSVPKISPQMQALRSNIANLTGTDINDIGITATTGEGLTAFGRGEGIQVFSIITVSKT